MGVISLKAKTRATTLQPKQGKRYSGKSPAMGIRNATSIKTRNDRVKDFRKHSLYVRGDKLWFIGHSSEYRRLNRCAIELGTVKNGCFQVNPSIAYGRQDLGGESVLSVIARGWSGSPQAFLNSCQKFIADKATNKCLDSMIP